MASNSIQVATIGYRKINGYTFTIEATLTGNTNGNSREVNILFKGSAYNDGGYYPNYDDNTATIYVNNSKVGSTKSVGDLRNGETITMNSWKGYIEAGQTIAVKGSYYSSYGDSYMPLLGTHSVTTSLLLAGLQSGIGSISDFIIEDAFSVPITKYDDSYTDKLDISLNDVLIKTIPNYTDGASIELSDTELLTAYNNLTSANYGTFIFKITTLSGSSEIGTVSGSATGTAKGTSKININGAWKRGIVWIKINGTWKRALMFIKNSSWKRGGD